MSPQPDYRTGESQGAAEAVPAEGTGAGEAATDSEADETSGSYICVVCQQPIGGEGDHRWKGEPVHTECGAELRCGVSVGHRSTPD